METVNAPEVCVGGVVGELLVGGVLLGVVPVVLVPPQPARSTVAAKINTIAKAESVA
jgi:hypothetical protein